MGNNRTFPFRITFICLYISCCTTSVFCQVQQAHLKLSQELKDFLVTRHNEFRALVDPPASNMLPIVWDTEVENYATEWAQCGEKFYAHRYGDDRYEAYGENLAFYGNADEEVDQEEALRVALQEWWSESEEYVFETGRCNSLCGHYTQMVWAQSSKLGCGYAVNCLEGEMLFGEGARFNFYMVCNYSPAGNFIGQKPYERGVAAPSSPTWTFGGNAKGANCVFPFIYEGSMYTDCVPPLDPSDSPWCKTGEETWGYCGTDDSNQCINSHTNCDMFLNVLSKGVCPLKNSGTPAETLIKSSCEATCGYCDCPTPPCKNGGRYDETCGCVCAGSWSGGDCSYCGMSAADCKHGGTLDLTTCSCKCVDGFTGPDCFCFDMIDDFFIEGYKFNCQSPWFTEDMCNWPITGRVLKRMCPVTCRSCPPYVTRINRQ